MSEIADELERMAEEFDKSRQDQHDRCAKAMEAGAVHAEVTARARAGALEGVVNRLRERAEEMRAQRSGPTYKPQPKPRLVTRLQWWSFRKRTPERVARVATDGANVAVFFGTNEYPGAHASRMLSSPDWLYLGDGEYPAT